MTRIILLFEAILLGTIAAMADNLTITRLTGNTVNIGGKNLKTGNTFDEGAAIVWATPTQKMEAKNTRTGAIYRFTAKQFASKKDIKSVKDFFLRVNKASTRNVTSADYTFHNSLSSAKYPEKRIALLIGNTNYTEISSLRNPAYDVESMSETLSELGFDVMEAYDCDYTDMRSALNSFAARAKDYDVALFYYSGHGLQEDGHNYLIPVNARLEFKSELDRCLNAYDVIDRMEGSGVETRIVCLDACRDVKTSWTRSSVHGLTTMEGSPGTAIICSTRSGQVALDGDADNSPFASSFINCMGEKGKNFSETMSNVVKQTYAATQQRQCPVVNGTLLSEFVFNPVGTVINKIEAKVSGRQTTPSASATSRRETPRPAPEGVIAESTYPGLKGVFSTPRRAGNKVAVDLVLINTTSQPIQGRFCGREPCAGYEDYQIAAWDEAGNEFLEYNDKIRILKGTDRSYDIFLRPGTPVKYTVYLINVPTTSSTIAELTVAFRDFDPTESYGQTLLRVANLPILK